MEKVAKGRRRRERKAIKDRGDMVILVQLCARV